MSDYLTGYPEHQRLPIAIGRVSQMAEYEYTHIADKQHLLRVCEAANLSITQQATITRLQHERDHLSRAYTECQNAYAQQATVNERLRLELATLRGQQVRCLLSEENEAAEQKEVRNHMSEILELARSHVDSLRNYRMPKEAIGTVAILDGLIAKIERLTAIVDKLPKTADGVPIVPDMVVWGYHGIRGLIKGTARGDLSIIGDYNGTGYPILEHKDCHSTREAAERQEEEKP